MIAYYFNLSALKKNIHLFFKAKVFLNSHQWHYKLQSLCSGTIYNAREKRRHCIMDDYFVWVDKMAG
jgi:hypothetical protein